MGLIVIWIKVVKFWKYLGLKGILFNENSFFRKKGIRIIFQCLELMISRRSPFFIFSYKTTSFSRSSKPSSIRMSQPRCFFNMAMSRKLSPHTNREKFKILLSTSQSKRYFILYPFSDSRTEGKHQFETPRLPRLYA